MQKNLNNCISQNFFPFLGKEHILRLFFFFLVLSIFSGNANRANSADVCSFFGQGYNFYAYWLNSDKPDYSSTTSFTCSFFSAEQANCGGYTCDWSHSGNSFSLECESDIYTYHIVYSGNVSEWPSCRVEGTMQRLDSLNLHGTFEAFGNGDADEDGVIDSRDDCQDSKIVSPFTVLQVDKFGCTPHQNIAEIIGLYHKLNLAGNQVYGPLYPGNGAINNLIDLATSIFVGRISNGHHITTFDGTAVNVDLCRLGGIVCSEYQLGILTWLDLLRQSDTRLSLRTARTYGDLMNGVNYGPISSFGGGHLAVVIYPTRSDWPPNYGWTTNGTVLDPWFSQRAETFSSIAWIFMNPYAAPYKLNDKPSYPLTGASGYQIMVIKEARQKRIEFLKKRERNGMIMAKTANSVQAEQEMYQTNAAEPNLRITNTRTGQRLGYFDGQFIHEIPESYLITIPGSSGEKIWSYSLPDDSYQVEISGQTTMQFNLISELHGKGIWDYRSQIMGAGQTSVLAIKPTIAKSPLTLPTGKVIYPIEWAGFANKRQPWMMLLLNDR